MTETTQQTLLQILLDNDKAHSAVILLDLTKDILLERQLAINEETLSNCRAKLPDLWPALEKKFNEAYKDFDKEKLNDKAQLLNDNMYKHLDKAINLFVNLVIVDKLIRKER